MFIELTNYHTGLGILINWNQVEMAEQEDERVAIFFRGHIFYVEEPLQDIINILSREGVLV